jgi:FkbM family methyltransferase
MHRLCRGAYKIPCRQESQSIRRLRVLNCGIGKETGKATINVFRDRCASLLPPLPNEVATEEKIDVVKFSRFLALTGVVEIDLLKLDIERAELDVIDSIDGETLGRIRQITVEFMIFSIPVCRDVSRRSSNAYGGPGSRHSFFAR